MRYLLLFLICSNAYCWDCRDVVETARAAEETQNVDLAIQALAMNDRTSGCLLQVNSSAIMHLNEIIDHALPPSRDFVVKDLGTIKEMCRDAAIQKSYLTLSSQWDVIKINPLVLSTNDRLCFIETNAKTIAEFK